MNSNLLEIFKNCKAKISKKRKQRKGRGDSSRKGVYAGRGRKGYNARSGSSIDDTFEGGQTRTIKKIPKFGFNNHNKNEIKNISLYLLLIKLSKKFNNNKLDLDIKKNVINISELFNFSIEIKILYDNRVNIAKINEIVINKKYIKNTIYDEKIINLLNYLNKNNILLNINKYSKNVEVFFNKLNIKIKKD